MAETKETHEASETLAQMLVKADLSKDDGDKVTKLCDSAIKEYSGYLNGLRFPLSVVSFDAIYTLLDTSLQKKKKELMDKFIAASTLLEKKNKELTDKFIAAIKKTAIDTINKTKQSESQQTTHARLETLMILAATYKRDVADGRWKTKHIDSFEGMRALATTSDEVIEVERFIAVNFDERAIASK